MGRSWVKFGFILCLALHSPGLALAEPAGNAKNPSLFKPYWGFQLGLNSSGTPGDRGGGQNANDLTFTVSRDFSEAGDFMSLGIMGGQQKVEGSAAKYGGLFLDGGLGLGFFSPSLSLTIQTGESALFVTTAGLNLGFQFFEDLSGGVNFSGGFNSHQVPFSALLPGAANTLVELDGKNIVGGLSVIWAASEIFSLTLNAQASDEITYQVQNLAHTVKIAANQSSVIPSSSLGFNWGFLKNFVLNGSFQRSEESQPASYSYSPSLGETVFNTAPKTLYFSGYTVGLTYSFQ